METSRAQRADASSWAIPAAFPALDARDVHVWKIALPRKPAALRELAALLSDDERETAGRFLVERGRARFIVCRGVVRTILGRYLGVAPQSIRFRYHAHGKPAVAAGAGAHRLRFNVSHAD